MIQKRIECPFPTSIYHTVTAHGWVNLAPWRWDSNNNELSRLERLWNGRLALVKVSQADIRNLVVQTDAETLGQRDDAKIESTVKRWLSINWDPRAAIRTAATLDPGIVFFIKQGGGRFLRSSTFYEDFVKTICTINTNWASTRRMVLSLVNQLGDGVFPTPLKIMDCGEGNLRQELRLGFRARVLADTSSQLLGQGWIDDQGNLIRENLAFEDLIALRGIGEYSASHIMMLTNDFRRIPIDSEVTRYCRENYDVEPEDIDSFFNMWGDYRFLGYKIHRIIGGSN